MIKILLWDGWEDLTTLLETVNFGLIRLFFLCSGLLSKAFLWCFICKGTAVWVCDAAWWSMTCPSWAKLWEWRLRNWEIDRVIAWIPTIVEDARILILIFVPCSGETRSFMFSKRQKPGWKIILSYVLELNLRKCKTAYLQHNIWD